MSRCVFGSGGTLTLANEPTAPGTSWLYLTLFVVFLTDLSVFPSRLPILGFRGFSRAPPTVSFAQRREPLPRGRKYTRFGKLEISRAII